MDLLAKLRVSCDLSRDEFGRMLSEKCNGDTVITIRSALFERAVSKGLANAGYILVRRQKSPSGKSIKKRHIDDIWLLVSSIRNGERVPRVLLKNGKWGEMVWKLSQEMGRQQKNVLVECEKNVNAAW